MNCQEDWPILEFPALRKSILARFSSESGESVSQVLIREIVENVDRPTGSSLKIGLENDQELDWIMQVINHAFDLPFHSKLTYQTLSSAIRIYLAWMTSLTESPHECCPEPLKTHPDKFFRKMIESFRSIFLPRPLNLITELEILAVNRQNTEIQIILTAIAQLTTKVRDDFKDEVWSRSLLFLMMVSDQLLSNTKNIDEIGCIVVNELSRSLFDSWVQAALQEFIPSPSYWRTLSTLTTKWIQHVSFFECWSRKLLSLTVLLIQQLYGNSYSPIQINDSKLLKIHEETSKNNVLRDVWLNLFQLIGNPITFLNQSAENSLDTSNLAYLNSKSSFFLINLTFSKMINLFFGDPNIPIDFYECDELHSQWKDSCAFIQEEALRHNSQASSHRSSNMSSTPLAAHSADTNTHHNNMGDSILHQNILSSKKSLVKSSLQKVSNRTNSNVAQNISTANSTNLNGDLLPFNSQNIANPSQTQLRSGQYVWFILRHNKFCESFKASKGPRSNALLEVFMPLLFDSALAPLTSNYCTSQYSEDVVSQHSLSSIDTFNNDAHQQLPHTAPITNHSQQNPFKRLSSVNLNTENNTVPVPMDSAHRHSFATQSTASSSDTPSSHNYVTVFDYPSVDGIAGGRATALGSLCRIVCAKSSKEELPDEQLAQFYLILHEALIERDRIILCSLIYYTVDLYKLNLTGIEVLLPNYLMAIDIILTESMKLRLHPSIHEIDMRNACLKSLASILIWPSTFGSNKILGSTQPSKLFKGGSTNVLESEIQYIDLRNRILKILLHTLRNETDFGNIHLTLSLSYIFCAENARYDICKAESNVLKKKKRENLSENSFKSEENAEETEKYFTISALRGVVSAICDNLCKSQWHLSTCLAALDCLNCLSTLPHSILFHKKELSTGSLIVSSLCRFIDSQLQKPPMFHSRDLHSSIVAAYSCLGTWLCAAPMLAEIESCLLTLAQIVEFGMTGGKKLKPENYKPASQRVFEAAENLLQILFADNSKKSSKFNNEEFILEKFGSENIEMGNFRHFLINEATILTLHEAQHIDRISNGLPTVIAICRTPFRQAHSSYFQLRPKVHPDKWNGNLKSPEGNLSYKSDTGFESCAQSPSTFSITSGKSLTNSNETQTSNPDNTKIRNILEKEKLRCGDGFGTSEPIKQFEFPTGINKPMCKLDGEFRPLEPIPEVTAIQEKLNDFKARLEHGASSPFGGRDQHNVWIQSSLGAILSQSPRPDEPATSCDSIRIFLYDMGLVNRKSFGKDFVPLTCESGSGFYDELYSLVDQSTVRLQETVSIFFVREGQRVATDILRNNGNFQNTSIEFCNFLSELGKGVDVAKSAPWVGNWENGFSTINRVNSSSNGIIEPNLDHYTMDGLNNCLLWSNHQIEMAFLVPFWSREKAEKMAKKMSKEDNFINNTNTMRNPKQLHFSTPTIGFELDESGKSSLIDGEILDLNQTYKKGLGLESYKEPNHPSLNRKNPETMLVLRPRISPFAEDLKHRRSYLKDSIEQISVLEEEYTRLSDQNSFNMDYEEFSINPIQPKSSPQLELLSNLLFKQQKKLIEETESKENSSKEVKSRKSKLSKPIFSIEKDSLSDLFLNKIPNEFQKSSIDGDFNNSKASDCKSSNPNLFLSRTSIEASNFKNSLDDDEPINQNLLINLQNSNFKTVSHSTTTIDIKPPAPSLRPLSRGLSCSAFNTASLLHIQSVAQELEFNKLEIMKNSSDLKTPPNSFEEKEIFENQIEKREEIILPKRHRKKLPHILIKSNEGSRSSTLSDIPDIPEELPVMHTPYFEPNLRQHRFNMSHNLLTVEESEEIYITPPLYNTSPVIQEELEEDLEETDKKSNESNCLEEITEEITPEEFLTKMEKILEPCISEYTTIHTVDKDTNPSLSMVSPTSVIVKSARFFPQRRKQSIPFPNSSIIVPNPGSRFSSSFSNRSPTTCFVSSASLSTTTVQANSNRLKNLTNVDSSGLADKKSILFPNNIDSAVTREDIFIEARRNSLASVAFSPFSSMAVEFTRRASSATTFVNTPLKDLESNSNEHDNMLLAMPNASASDSCDSGATFIPENTTNRRKSIIQHALDFVKIGSRKNCVEEDPPSNLSVLSKRKSNMEKNFSEKDKATKIKDESRFKLIMDKAKLKAERDKNKHKVEEEKAKIKLEDKAKLKGDLDKDNKIKEEDLKSQKLTSSVKPLENKLEEDKAKNMSETPIINPSSLANLNDKSTINTEIKPIENTNKLSQTLTSIPNPKGDCNVPTLGFLNSQESTEPNTSTPTSTNYLGPSTISSISYIKSFFRRINEDQLKSEKETKKLEEKLPKSEIKKSEQNFLNDIDEVSDSNSSKSEENGESNLEKEHLKNNQESVTRGFLNSSSKSAQSSKRFSVVDLPPLGPQTTATSANCVKRSVDQRIFVVWLEKIEDMYHFPYEQMFNVSEMEEDSSNQRKSSETATKPKPDFVIIYLHNFEAGLVRIHTQGIWTKCGQPGPLLDGMIVSLNSLAHLIQQTVCNISRRKIVELDNYQMSHIKKRQAIAKFGKKFATKLEYGNFLEQFLN